MVLSSFALAKPANAQDTWQQVYTILNTNCTGSGCHGGGRPDFDVTAPSADLYDALVGIAPANPTAAGKGNKYIDPGYPARSFLLRKVANCLSSDLALESPAEGNPMPDGRPKLADQEIELIRQWIIYGAPETGKVVEKTIIDDYYTKGGVPKLERPDPPKSCEGFQVHMGPLFFKPREESEWFQRYDLNLPDTLEVTGLELFFNDESHHFILRKFKDGTAQSWPQGVTPLNPLTAFDSDKDYVMAWQDDAAYMLPNGTAYIWKPTESLDLNFHMFNYHNEILPGEVYMNVYTQPKGNALKEMKSSLINSTKIGIGIGGLPGGNITNNNQPLTFEDTDGTRNVSIWTLTSHTHKYGINYDIFFRNPNGSKGRQIFDGTYNYLQGFDTGVYDWEHPPTAVYEPFLDMSDAASNNGTVPNGLIHSVTYKNYGPKTVGFGFTTEDEMMIFYMQYVDGTFNIPANPTWVAPCSTEVFKDVCDTTTTTPGIFNIVRNANNISLYPNPTTGLANVEYSLYKNAANVNLQVVNILGEVVAVLVNEENQATGEYAYQFNGTNHGPGVYFIRLMVDGQLSTQKLILSGK